MAVYADGAVFRQPHQGRPTLSDRGHSTTMPGAKAIASTSAGNSSSHAKGSPIKPGMAIDAAGASFRTHHGWTDLPRLSSRPRRGPLLLAGRDPVSSPEGPNPLLAGRSPVSSSEGPIVGHRQSWKPLPLLCALPRARLTSECGRSTRPTWPSHTPHIRPEGGILAYTPYKAWRGCIRCLRQRLRLSGL